MDEKVHLNVATNIDIAKNQAKIMHEDLKGSGIKLSFCYEILAHMNGFKDWNTYCAKLNQEIK